LPRFVASLRDGIRSLAALLARQPVRVSLVVLVTTSITTAILGLGLIPAGYDYSEGDIAVADIRAPRTVLDPVETERRQVAAEQAAVERARENLEYYTIDPYASSDAVSDLQYIIARVAEARQALFYESVVVDQVPIAQNSPEGLAGEDDSAVDKLPDGATTELRRKAPAPTASEIESEAAALAEQFWKERGIELGIGSLRALLQTETATLSVAEARVSVILQNILGMTKISASEVMTSRNEAERRVRNLGLVQDLTNAMVEIARVLIDENLVPDSKKLEEVRREARRSAESAYIKEGEVIVRSGEQISVEHLRVLQELGLLGRKTGWLSLLGIVMFSSLAVAFSTVYISKFNPHLGRNTSGLVLYSLLMVLAVGLTQLIAAILPSPSTGGPGFLVPVAFATMLISALIDTRIAVVSAAVLAAIVGLIFGESYRFGLVALVGGITGALSITRHSDRSGLMRSGFIVAAAQILTVVSTHMMVADFNLVFALIQAGFTGMMSAVLTIGTLPFLENLFGVTSSIRFLELANPNQPLLKRMLVEAPGTYHHSIIVGNLAEAAANDIGADALLVRVGALYHDIGKLKRPYFFIENQLTEENPHDKLSPSLSTLIITSHVKDGVDMAREAKLPKEIVDIIEQHHGTTIVSYFHRRAQENAQKSDEPVEVDERDFRYAGPRPRSQEAALVMLGDSVEAAVRSLSKPTPDRIDNLVRRIVKDRLNDGQFDECDITFRDLDTVVNAFVRVLTGIFHARVEYPEAVLREMQKRDEGRRPHRSSENPAEGDA
jgi:putative nucleotidyltransferase with HDIG domain